MDAIELAWVGLDDDSRLDVASIEYGPHGGFVATGRQSTSTYRAQWDLVVDAAWRTQLLTVDVEGWPAAGEGSQNSEPPPPTWQRHLNLWRRDTATGSSWRCEVGESGDVPSDFGPAGFADVDAGLLHDAVDVDLAGCPLTNVMPIQRLGVMKPGVPPHTLTLAWVSLPECAVIPATQTYASAAPGLAELATTVDERVASVVRYESRTRQVAVDLSVDGFGHVIDYPDLARRLDVS